MLDTPKAQSDQVLSLNDDLRRRARRSLYLLMYLGSNVPVNPGVWSIRLGRDHGQARVGFFPDGHMERHFPKERYAKTLGFLVCAAVSENIRACAATGAKKITHVLDHAQHWHIHPLEHGNAAPGVDQREILGC